MFHVSSDVEKLILNLCVLYSPDDSGHDTTCLDNCNTAFCTATYYSNDVRMPSQSCTPCNDPTDLDCLHDWSKCVRKKDKATYGSVSSFSSLHCNNLHILHSQKRIQKISSTIFILVDP